MLFSVVRSYSAIIVLSNEEGGSQSTAVCARTCVTLICMGSVLKFQLILFWASEPSSKADSYQGIEILKDPD